MPGPGLITGYLETLSGQLPWPVVEELADGLEETYRRHLGLGLAPDAAAEAAVAEFGAPELIAAEFARAHPARRAARRLLVTGPASMARLVLNVRLVRPVLAGNGLHDRAAALDQDDIAPAPIMLADTFPCPDDAEPGGPVQGHAGGVLREDAGLDGPDPGRLGRDDQGLQQPAADALAAGGGVDVL